MADEELKRCPFCGGEAKVVLSGWNYGIECTECAGSLLPVRYQSKEEAIAAWNRRDLEEEHREQLVQELEDLKNREDAYGHPSTKYGIQLAIGKIKEVGV